MLRPADVGAFRCCLVVSALWVETVFGDRAFPKSLPLLIQINHTLSTPVLLLFSFLFFLVVPRFYVNAKSPRIPSNYKFSIRLHFESFPFSGLKFKENPGAV